LRGKLNGNFSPNLFSDAISRSKEPNFTASHQRSERRMSVTDTSNKKERVGPIGPTRSFFKHEWLERSNSIWRTVAGRAIVARGPSAKIRATATAVASGHDVVQCTQMTIRV